MSRSKKSKLRPKGAGAKLLALLVGLAILGMFLGEGAAWAIPEPSSPAPPLAETEKPAPAEAEQEVEEYVFDPSRIPDPFLSYLVKRVAAEQQQAEEERLRAEEEERKLAAAEEALKQKKRAAAEKLQAMKEPRTELQRFELTQLTLTAIVNTGTRGYAMVRDPTGRGFVLKDGTLIGKNGGRIGRISIQEKKVVIEEPYLEDEIHIKFRPVEMKLPDEYFE